MTMDTTGTISKELAELDARYFSFYQLVELLMKLKQLDVDDESWERQCQVIFKSNPSLGFSISDVSDLAIEPNDTIALETTFLGLTGAQSPLPSFMLEEVLNEGEMGVRGLFLDFFNNRLITLAYRIWRKYRYYVRFQQGASDPISNQLFALVGLSDPDLRGDTPINWCKMLTYAGMLAGRSRSPQVVSGIIAHCFDLKEVEVRQWIPRKVSIDTSQRMKLGKGNSILGRDTVIGNRVTECNGKFTLILKGLNKNQFRNFLPIGRDYLPLSKVTEFILREQMAYDLELQLERDAVTALVLNKETVNELGWSTFLGNTKTADHQSVTIQVRQ